MIVNFLLGKGLIISSNLKAFRPPLYPIFASMFFYNSGLWGVRFAQCFVGALTSVFIYLIGKKIFSTRIGWIAGIISCFYPFLIFYTGFLLTDALAILLTVISIWCLIHLVPLDNQDKSKQNLLLFSILSGISLGLAGLERPTMEAFVPFVLFFILSFRESWIRKIKKIVIISVFFTLTLSPWIIRNYIIFHEFIPGTTMGSRVFWEGNNPYSIGGPSSYFPQQKLKNKTEIQMQHIYLADTIQVIKTNPKRFLWLLWNKFKRFWAVVPNTKLYSSPKYKMVSVFSFGILLPFFIIGFFLTLRNKKVQFLHLIIIFFTLFHMVLLASIIYRAPIEPFIIIIAVVGFLWLKDKIYEIKYHNTGV
jgi:4-amino-4-deoxy-L-arabinose transferase-like glycosyltransferase